MMNWDEITSAPPINELIDNEGGTHNRYVRLSRKLGYEVCKPSTPLRRKLSDEQPLGDRLRVYPVPLVLSSLENKRIISGLEQRTLTLARFFEDVVLGRGRCFIDRVIAKKAVSAFFKDEGWPLLKLQEVWSGKKFKDISILMGPDLLRNPLGEWVVIEDNIGGTDVMLGGLADLHVSRLAFLDAANVKLRLNKFPDPLEIFLQKWRNINSIEDKKLLVAIGVRCMLYPMRKFRDKEDFRLMKTIRSVFPEAISYGDFLLMLSSKPSKLQYNAILNLGTDFTHASYPNLISCFQNRRFSFFTGIGTEVLGNKGLLPYIDKLTKYYLQEDSILRTQPTQVVNPLKLDFQCASQKVVKRANGLQGNEVHIFPRMREKKKRAVFNHLQEELENTKEPIWIEQQYIPASFIRDANTGLKMEINLRPFSYFVDEKVYTSDLPWGRIGSNASQPLVNISQGAHELVVFDEDSILKVRQIKKGLRNYEV